MCAKLHLYIVYICENSIFHTLNNPLPNVQQFPPEICLNEYYIYIQLKYIVQKSHMIIFQ